MSCHLDMRLAWWPGKVRKALSIQYTGQQSHIFHLASASTTLVKNVTFSITPCNFVR